MTTLLNLLSESKKPHGSIISNFAPKQAQVLIIAAVFCGISGSYNAIFGPEVVELFLI